MTISAVLAVTESRQRSRSFIFITYVITWVPVSWEGSATFIPTTGPVVPGISQAQRRQSRNIFHFFLLSLKCRERERERKRKESSPPTSPRKGIFAQRVTFDDFLREPLAELWNRRAGDLNRLLYRIEMNETVEMATPPPIGPVCDAVSFDCRCCCRCCCCCCCWARRRRRRRRREKMTNRRLSPTDRTGRVDSDGRLTSKNPPDLTRRVALAGRLSLGAITHKPRERERERER